MNEPRSRDVTPGETRDLTKKALGGASASIAGRIGGLAASFAALSILARLLTPEDYGTYSIILMLSGLAALIPQALGNAITQESQLDQQQVAGAFTVVTVSSVIFAALFYLGYGLFVQLYPDFNLAPYAWVLAVLIPLTSITAYFDAVQARQFRFRTIALIELFTTNLLQAAVSIALAIAGFGAWSLLLGFLAAAFVKLLAQLFTGMSTFSRIQTIHSRMQRSSAWFLGIGVVNYVGRNGDNAIVGYLLGPSALGIYSRAFNLMMRPVTTLGGTVMSVFYPMISSIGQDTARVRAGYLKAVELTAVLCLPPSVFACIYSEDIILLLFGRDWSAVSSPFRVLIAALYFRLAYRVTESIAFSKKALPGAALRQAFYGASVVTGSIVGATWGVTGIAAGVTAALCIFFLLSSTFANRLSHTSFAAFAHAHEPALTIALVVALVISALKAYLGTHFQPLPSLLTAFCVFLLTYSGLILFGPSLLYRNSSLEEMRLSVRNKLIRRVLRRP